MKKGSFISIVFFFIFLSNSAKSQTPIIEYDFSKGEFAEGDFVSKGKIKPVKNGGFVIFRVINVNTFRYDVSIEGKSIEYITQVPSELQTIFRLPASGTTQTNQAITNANTGAAGALSALQKTSQKLYDAKIALDGKDATKKELAKAKASDDAMDAFAKACAAYAEATKKAAIIKLRRIELIDISKQNWENFKELTKALPSPELLEADMTNDFRQFSDTYSDVQSTSIDAIAKGEEEQEEKVKNILKLMSESYKGINDDGFLNLIRDVKILQTAFKNKSSFIVTSPPIQVDGDFISFKVSATPAKASDLLNYISEKGFPVEIPVRGGWKADFSVGPIVSFGNGSKDDKYFLEDTSDPDMITLKQRNNKNKISPGLAAMMHFYPRTGWGVSAGWMLGVGAGFQSVSDVNFTLYTGPTIVIGKLQKIMISGGFSFLKVDRLKEKEYEVNHQYATSKIDLANVTEKVFDTSFFLSITYNITNKIEIK